MVPGMPNEYRREGEHVAHLGIHAKTKSSVHERRRGHVLGDGYRGRRAEKERDASVSALKWSRSSGALVARTPTRFYSIEHASRNVFRLKIQPASNVDGPNEGWGQWCTTTTVTMRLAKAIAQTYHDLGDGFIVGAISGGKTRFTVAKERTYGTEGYKKGEGNDDSH